LPLFYFSSCTEDSSTTPTVDARDKFTGDWTCTEKISGSGDQVFPIQISNYGSEDTVIISNFSNYGSTADAYGLVVGNSLIIPSQNIGVSSLLVGGTGIFSGSGAAEKITMNYSTDGASATAVCRR